MVTRPDKRQLIEAMESKSDKKLAQKIFAGEQLGAYRVCQLIYAYGDGRDWARWAGTCKLLNVQRRQNSKAHLITSACRAAAQYMAAFNALKADFEFRYSEALVSCPKCNKSRVHSNAVHCNTCINYLVNINTIVACNDDDRACWFLRRPELITFWNVMVGTMDGFMRDEAFKRLD